MRFKNIEGNLEWKSSKRTISTGGGLGPLQMVSGPNTGRCVSKEVSPEGGRWPPKRGGLGVPHSIRS